MKKLPNGLTVWNATPHPIKFWCEEWKWYASEDAPEDLSILASMYDIDKAGVIIVGPDEMVNAKIINKDLGVCLRDVEFVTPIFAATEEGCKVIEYAKANGANLIVGSIIAAQAYPGEVVSPVCAKEYDRVPPDQRRAMPNRFAMFKR